jgi:hypothetical protein
MKNEQYKNKNKRKEDAQLMEEDSNLGIVDVVRGRDENVEVLDCIYTITIR